jgi:hypothetical protein
MADFKTIFGIAASVLGVISFLPYLRDVLRRKTKPHLFTWLVWGVLLVIAFIAQILRGAGSGSWITGITAVTCFLTAGLAVHFGEKDIRVLDWMSLLGAALGLVLWGITSDPLLAVILICIVDVLGFVPTLRKGYAKPHEETLIFYVLSALKFAAGLIALRSYSPITYLFPALVAFTNAFFATTLILRRRFVSKQSGETNWRATAAENT